MSRAAVLRFEQLTSTCPWYSNRAPGPDGAKGRAGAVQGLATSASTPQACVWLRSCPRAQLACGDSAVGVHIELEQVEEARSGPSGRSRSPSTVYETGIVAARAGCISVSVQRAPNAAAYMPTALGRHPARSC